MGILGRAVFGEIVASAMLGTLVFTFVLFLQRATRLFEPLVRGSADVTTVGYLFALILPPALTFTLPLGVLVGTLIGLSRMSSDGEIVAMRAAGVPSRRVVYPVLTFAAIAMAATAAASLWLTPWSIRETYRVLNRLAASEMTAQIQPRVFEEKFPNTVLYVGDIIPGTVPEWRNVFLADLTPPERRTGGPREQGEGPRITLASRAVAVPDIPNNRIQLSMLAGSSHEVGKNPAEYFNSTFPRGEQVLQAERPGERRPTRAFSEMDTLPLWREAYRNPEQTLKTEARIELHQRLVLPPACILLALVGIPLGVSSRRSGKSAAFVMTVFLAFLYYMSLISLISLARQGTLPPAASTWLPNLAFGLFGLTLMGWLERPGDRDAVGAVRGWLVAWLQRFRIALPEAPAGVSSRRGPNRLPLLPQLIDTYVLTSFLFYFALLLASFVLMTQVFTFFELLSDILRRQIPMTRVATYLFFLTPKLIYDSTPVSVLVAVLVTFGILTKQNEITAMKACGVSIHRLAIPVIVTSGMLSAGLFAFDHYYVPDANRRQEAIRSEIKGRPVQTYLNPGRNWIMGRSSRIYYYKYFEQAEGVMVGVSVYELDKDTFRLRRHISAERARWEPVVNAWIFQNGWTREIRGIRVADHRTFQAATFAELDEPPSYFLKEVKQEKQMNTEELSAYIRDLQQSGFDTIQLQVQFHRKFSVPLFAVIMAMISLPFAFLTGNRGAMAGVGVSFGIAVAYWAVSQMFEQTGRINQLPPAAAAWAPDALFSLAGLYLMARMRT